MRKFKIYYFTPYDLDKNLGAAYNHYMSLIKNDEDWACFLDADAMFLTPDFGTQIHSIVSKYPDTGMFVAVTNRVGTTRQRYKGIVSEDPDIKHHRVIAMKLQKQFYDTVEDFNMRASGFLMLVQKKTWKKIKFTDGLLGVDYAFSNDLLYSGRKILLMKGVYMLHYYRFLEGRFFKDHLL
jgi:GT2 family glycosyltransferase